MKYTVVLLADAEKGYTAVVPALPGCVSEGDSAEEALDMVAEAIALYLESAKEHGEESPTELPGTLIGEVEIDPSGLRAERIASSPKSRRP
jgi:predicted RNase H-like HicB family nuclease